MTEYTSVAEPIMKELRSRGYWIMKIHGSNLQAAGVPDLIGCQPGGRFFALECKVGKERPSPLQAYCLKEISDTGGIAACVHSLDEALTALGEDADGTPKDQNMCAVKPPTYAEVVVSDTRYEQAMRVIRNLQQKVSEDDAVGILFEIGLDDGITYDAQGRFQLTLSRLQWISYAAALASATEQGAVQRLNEATA